MTALAPVSTESTLAEGFNVLSDWADRMISGVRGMPDETIIETARMATELEGQAFRVRGACAAELRRRIRRRAAGDERKIGAAFDELARQVGVHTVTLRDDCRIFEEFGNEIIVNNYLPREVYRLALTARDPRSAVEMYQNRKETDARYSTLDYRRDISELNRGRTDSEAPSPAAHRMYFDLSPKAISAIKLICDRLQCDDEEAVARALVYAARAVEEGRDI
jgi:hypothetical protein